MRLAAPVEGAFVYIKPSLRKAADFASGGLH